MDLGKYKQLSNMQVQLLGLRLVDTQVMEVLKVNLDLFRPIIRFAFPPY